jgi:hypothetical protein
MNAPAHVALNLRKVDAPSAQPGVPIGPHEIDPCSSFLPVIAPGGAVFYTLDISREEKVGIPDVPRARR